MPRRPARPGATARSPRRWRPASTPSPGGRPRCRSDPQALRQLRQTAHLRRCRRGQADRTRLFSAAQRTQAVDADAAGNRRGGVEHCRSRQRQHNRAPAAASGSRTRPLASNVLSAIGVSASIVGSRWSRPHQVVFLAVGQEEADRVAQCNDQERSMRARSASRLRRMALNERWVSLSAALARRCFSALIMTTS